MSTPTNDNSTSSAADENERRSSKLKGFAIVALCAYIKALEMNAGVMRSKGQYRYQIDNEANGNREQQMARIYLVSGGEAVIEKPLADWAKEGRPIRLAFIGLKDAKEKLEKAGDQPRVLYTLNAISGEAYLSLNGKRRTDGPQSIADWAVIGRQVQDPYFEELELAKQVAQDYGTDEPVRLVLERMVALGIIRDKHVD